MIVAESYPALFVMLFILFVDAELCLWFWRNEILDGILMARHIARAVLKAVKDEVKEKTAKIKTRKT